MYEDSSVLAENTPTSEEWKKLEEVFKEGVASNIILALKESGNRPQDVASFNSKMRQGSLGGINSSLLRQGVPFRLEVVHENCLFRENQVRLRRVLLPKPKIVETPRENSRRCC